MSYITDVDIEIYVKFDSLNAHKKVHTKVQEFVLHVICITIEVWCTQYTRRVLRLSLTFEVLKALFSSSLIINMQDLDKLL